MNNFYIFVVLWLIQLIAFVQTYKIYKIEKGYKAKIASQYRYFWGILGAILIPFFLGFLLPLSIGVKGEFLARLGICFSGNFCLGIFCLDLTYGIEYIFVLLFFGILGTIQAYPLFTMIWILFSTNQKLKKKTFVIVILWITALIILVSLLSAEGAKGMRH